MNRIDEVWNRIQEVPNCIDEVLNLSIEEEAADIVYLQISVIVLSGLSSEKKEVK
ncbi:MAG: hypothetical protein GTO45_19805 [Candidatus Aminicenantes bacterium]|nr:hypothetical protein [Candidatus Aminicenantes bacterium]NIM81037.1 hypothetical protein [Candidatus Aminicenantes bacterium]NIN20416.1 hypothetical protein [Candidatus Aminicenantes bacterium]NIN44189.1 hypothetical protein [Candidatus Aminicenantes bacterium]NIN87007.1 hypothetical protein [Candidatus Aminicenantes bacterium]